MQKENVLQKIAGLLNTSSQTFMLIALVSLFVLPVVLAKNLEPVVKDAYKSNTTAKVNEYDPSRNLATETSNPNSSYVLGVNTEKTMRTNLVENLAGLKFFDNHSSTLTDSTYTLTITTSKRFSKLELFRVKNTGTSTKSYNFNAYVEGDAKLKSNQQKEIYIDSKIYNLGDGSLPTKLLISPNQEVVVSAQSSKTSPSNITVSIVEVTE